MSHLNKLLQSEIAKGKRTVSIVRVLGCATLDNEEMQKRQEELFKKLQTIADRMS